MPHFAADTWRVSHDAIASLPTTWQSLVQLNAPELSAVSEHYVMNPRTAAIIASILSAQPDAAISVWQPRRAPDARRTSRLKLFNSKFRELCDAASFGDGEFHNVFVASFVSRDDIACTLTLSLERIVQMADALHLRDCTAVTCAALLLSRVGRPKSVHIEMRAIRGAGALEEFLIVFVERPTSPLLMPSPISAA